MKTINHNKFKNLYLALVGGFFISFFSLITSAQAVGFGVGTSSLVLGSGENLFYGNINSTSNATSNFLLFQKDGATNLFKIGSDGSGYFAGNVGIGTTTPVQKLQVEGNIRISSNKLMLGGGNADSFIQHNGSTLITFHQANWGGDFKFSAADSGGTAYDRLFIEGSGGNVGIGTSTPTTARLVLATAGTNALDAGSARITGLATGVVASDAVNYSQVQSMINTATSSLGNYWTLNSTNLYPTSTTYNVGVGTTNPTYKLDVAGNAMVRGAGTYNNNANSADLQIGYGIVGAGGAGSVSRLAIQPYGHTGGPFKFVARDTVSKAYLDINYGSSNLFTFDASGMVGIGTTTPNTKLHVLGSIKSGGIGVNGALYLDNGADGGGGATLSYAAASGLTIARIRGLASNIIMGDSGIELQTEDSTSPYTKRTRMIIKHGDSGNVGIGTSTVTTAKLVLAGAGTYSLDAGSFRVTNLAAAVGASDATRLSDVQSEIAGSFLAARSATFDLGGYNIVNVGKLTVGTVDPLYDIFGTKYSTYGTSIAGGVKEESLGQINISKKVTQGYEAVINFSNLEVGSDLWVWRRVVDFSADKVQVFITPYGSFAQTYYIIDNNKLIFRSDRPVQISYRLVGNRFDWKSWPTKAVDQSEKASLIIK